MKPIMIALTFALATLTVASTMAPKPSTSVLDRTVLVSDDDPPPICPPICSNSSNSTPIVVRRP
jgi:hypothetical protein